MSEFCESYSYANFFSLFRLNATVKDAEDFRLSDLLDDHGIDVNIKYTQKTILIL